MATTAWSTNLRHNNDEQFRTWGQEFSNNLAASGLIQTADTGQIDWSTAIRPGTNTFAGDEFWRFNDSLQGIAPVYLRFRYGTGGNAGTARMGIAVGTGTDGSGNLTGLKLEPGNIFESYIFGNRTDIGIALLSIMNYAGGVFCVGWKHNNVGLSLGLGWAVVNRSTTPTGDFDGRWVSLHCIGQTNRVLSFENNKVLSEVSSAPIVLIPGNENNSLINGTTRQVYIPFVSTPKLSPVVGMCVVFASELPARTTFTVKLVGDIEKTYLVLGSEQFSSNSNIILNGNVNTHYIALLWE